MIVPDQQSPPSPMRLIEMLSDRFGAFEALACSSIKLSRLVSEDELSMDLYVAKRSWSLAMTCAGLSRRRTSGLITQESAYPNGNPPDRRWTRNPNPPNPMIASIPPAISSPTLPVCSGLSRRCRIAIAAPPRNSSATMNAGCRPDDARGRAAVARPLAFISAPSPSYRAARAHVTGPKLM